MEFLFSILDSLFSPVIAFFSRNFRYFFSCEQYIDSLQKEMLELKSKRDDVQREVDHEARQGMEATNEVVYWLKNVDEAEKEAAEIINEFMTTYANPAERKSNYMLGYRLSKRADGACEEASILMSKSSFQKITHKLDPVRFEEMPSVPTVGMEPLIEELKHLYKDEDVAIIGIHGMGGVGKTALLNRFNNEVILHASNLDLVISVKISKDFDVAKIQRAIGYRLGLSWDDKKTEDERAMVLFKVLNKMRFLLLLDDLWQPLELEAIGIPTPTGKSKIILTTRIEDICDRMDAKKFKVDCLQQEDAWELFKKKAGNVLISSDPKIQRYAEDLANKCGGLPLALITVGRAMASKRTMKEWKHAVTTFCNTPWHLLGMEENVLHCLKQSYDKLEDEGLQTCLLCSALVHSMDMVSIHKASITELCIGEGVIDDFDDPENAYSEGYHLLGVLKAASLLQSGDDDDHVKMHPLIRAMVSWIVCECGKKDNRWLVQTSAALTEAPEIEKWRGAERISLISNEITSLPEEPDCPRLLTLLLSGNQQLKKISQGFFQLMPCLRILDLSHTSIRELPAGICSLIKLQHLNLSETSIISIPKELRNLVKLRFLILSNTPLLRTIPDGVFAGLKELQALCMYSSYGKWRLNSTGSGIDFEELEIKRRLRYLDITIEDARILDRVSKSRRLATSIRYMHIRACKGLTTIQLPSTSLGKCMKGLRCLRISHSTKLEELVVGGGGDANEWSYFPNLHALVLQQLPKAKIIFKDQYFSNLRYFYMWHCSGIEQMINFTEEVTGEDSQTVAAFPHLKVLELVHLPELNSLGGERRILAFPCLKLLHVNNCPKFRKLSIDADELTTIKGSQEWLDGLEWEDENTKEAFMPLFTPL